jgi:hypothetical protein
MVISKAWPLNEKWNRIAHLQLRLESSSAALDILFSKCLKTHMYMFACILCACVRVCVYIYIYGPVLRLSTPPSPPHGLGPQVAAPIPFYLQAIGSISEVQLRIC